ncbi:MAG: hypothetical protein ACR2M5_16685 [Nakamurella sp.]
MSRRAVHVQFHFAVGDGQTWIQEQWGEDSQPSQDGRLGHMAACEPMEVISPGPWRTPNGRLAGWKWLPNGFAAVPQFDQLSRWIQLWTKLPFIDRYGYYQARRRGDFIVVNETTLTHTSG